jgi:hypothetical protein
MPNISIRRFLSPVVSVGAERHINAGECSLVLAKKQASYAAKMKEDVIRRPIRSSASAKENLSAQKWRKKLSSSYHLVSY